MSLLSTLSHKIAGNPLQISLITGVLSSSYFICGNLGAAFFGIVPAAQDETGVELPVSKKVELWKWYYDRAKIHFASSTIISATAFSIAAFRIPSGSVRNLLLSTALSSFLVVPFTVFAMLPINNRLGAMLQSKQFTQPTEKTAVSSNSVTKLDQQAMKDIQTWKELHRVRMAFGTWAWISGLAGLVLCL